MSDIILINGSVNPESNTKRLITLMSKVLETKGYSTKVIHVAKMDLPTFNPTMRIPKSIEELWSELIETKAFIIGSPEYHGGYSGALKNFIDYLHSDIFQNKPLGLVVSTGGIKSGINTLNGLRIVFRSLYAHVIPEQFSISEQEYVNNDLTPLSKKRLLEVVNGLHTYLDLLKLKQQPIL